MAALAQYQREEMAEGLLNESPLQKEREKLDKRKEAMVARETVFADDFYEQEFKEEVSKLMKLAKKIEASDAKPEWKPSVITRDRNIKILIEGECSYQPQDSIEGYTGFEFSKPMPFSSRNHYSAHHVPPKSGLGKRLKRLRTDRAKWNVADSDWDGRYTQLRHKIISTLKSYRTHKQVAENFPEAYVHMPLDQKEAFMPVPASEDLKAQLGL